MEAMFDRPTPADAIPLGLVKSSGRRRNVSMDGVATVERSTDAGAAPCRTNILQLNDDCLVLVFRRLDMRQQLTLTEVCERFATVVVDLMWRYTYRTLYTCSNETRNLTKEQYMRFVELVVPHVDRLILSDTRGLSFTSYLGRYGIRPDLLFYLSFNFPRLRALEIADPGFHDGHVNLLIKRCPALEEFCVHSPYVTGSSIDLQLSLRKLNLRNCAVGGYILAKLLSSLHITHLDVANNPCTADVITAAERPDLLELTISVDTITTTEFFENIKQLKNLKHLRIIDSPLAEEPFSSLKWEPFFRRVGGNVKSLRMCSFTLTPSFADRFVTFMPLLAPLQRLEIHEDGGYEIGPLQSFRGLRSLRQLRLNIWSLQIEQAFEFLDLIAHCNTLDEVHFMRFAQSLTYNDLFLLVVGAIDRVGRQRNGRPALLFYIHEHALGDHITIKLESILKKDYYQRQSAIELRLGHGCIPTVVCNFLDFEF